MALTAPLLDWLLAIALDGMPAPKVAMVRLLVTELPYLFGVPILLRVALQNLFDQAIKLSVPKREIFVELSVEPESEMVVFDIRFISDRFDVLDQDVFERRRSSDTDRSPISSLGLFVVRQVAREMAGEIRLASESSGKTNFKLSLPY